MMYETIGKKSAEWAGMTAQEVKTIGTDSGSVLVIPVGSIEQHGSHLPVVTDTLLAEAVVDKALDRLENKPVVVTPPVWSGFSPHHLMFGGTLSMEFEQLRAMLKNVAETGLENGFDAVLFVNGHGGNGPLISSVVSTVGIKTDAEVLGTTYFELASDYIETLRESETGGMAHGGEFETSLMLSLRPDLVGEPSEYESETLDEPYQWAGQDLLDGGSVDVYRSFDFYSDSGAIGLPEQASAEKGERMLAIVSEELTALIKTIHERNSESRK